MNGILSILGLSLRLLLFQICGKHAVAYREILNRLRRENSDKIEHNHWKLFHIAVECMYYIQFILL